MTGSIDHFDIRDPDCLELNYEVHENNDMVITIVVCIHFLMSFPTGSKCFAFDFN